MDEISRERAATLESRSETTGSEASADRRALTPEVSHFLVQLSIALHKTVTYPAGHPALESAVRGLTLRLNAVLTDRQSVGIGVARDKLVIEGGTTDPGNAVLRGLAEALHRHQIGALRFERGVSPAEVSGLLTALAVDTRQNPPMGTDEEALRRWSSIKLLPIALDELELANGERRASRAEQLWLSLAAATLHRDPTDEMSGDAVSAQLARAIRGNVQDASYDRVIAEYMLQVGKELVDKGGTATQVADQFGELVAELGDDTLRMLLELGADLASRKQLILDLSRALPARSVVTLTRAAANASKQGISDALLRLFGKMAANAETHSGPVSAASDVVLRDAIGQLVEGWTLADPNPERYRELLRYLSVTGRKTEATAETASHVDALMIVHVALETGATGQSVWRALDELITYGRLTECHGSTDLGRRGQGHRRVP